MGEAMRTISFKVRTASCGGTACVNSFGDEQLAVDMLADKLLFEVLRSLQWLFIHSSGYAI
jgi:sedoheptulose-bisphosphatase